MIDHFIPGKVYNLGSKKQYSIESVSNLILKSLGKDDSLVTYEEGEAFTTRFKIANSSNAKKDLNHKITVPLEEGIPKTVEWFRSYYE